MVQEIKLSIIQKFQNLILLITNLTNITITGHQATKVAFKNCALFTKCITKIDEITIDVAENLDLVMPMYNLLEHIQIQFKLF